jgi:ribosomal protein S18 acetylase RimI-like enzyme
MPQDGVTNLEDDPDSLLDVQIRPMREDDFPEVTRLVEKEPHIVRHTNYTYWVLRAMDPESLLVAEGPDGLAGFLAGVYQFQPEHALLVQIAVRSGAQRAGIGSALAEEFVRRSLDRGAPAVQLTLDGHNDDSLSFFEACAARNGWTLRGIGDTGTLGGVLDEETVWELVP